MIKKGILSLFLTLLISGAAYQSQKSEHTGREEISKKEFSIQELSGDPERGKKLYAVCQTCHGANGQGRKNLGGPRLAGQHAWYLKRQIKNFQDGIRGTHPEDTYGAQMRPMANTVPNEQDIEDVVAYIMTLEAPKPEPTLERGDPERGKQFFGTCQTCHGANGQGRKNLGGPKLAGQHDWYLLRQLKNFRKGIRGTNPKDTYGAQMRPMANSLPDEQALLDVVAYIQTLDPETK